ncbi:hypothetical protein TNCV_1223811 [Trichonephila clavipes]|nr:hypothetical protein TNCV_1223811 [Trichonephila clavipes]
MNGLHKFCMRGKIRCLSQKLHLNHGCLREDRIITSCKKRLPVRMGIRHSTVKRMWNRLVQEGHFECYAGYQLSLATYAQVDSPV